MNSLSPHSGSVHGTGSAHGWLPAPSVFGWIGRVVLVLSLLVLAACGTTIEAQQDRFKRNKDTISALMAKHPKMRDAVAEALKGFEAEADTIVKAGGDNAKTELARLNSRMEEYVKKLDPALAGPASAASQTPPSGKLGAPDSMAPGSMGAPVSMAPVTMAPVSMAPVSMAPVSAAPMSAAPALGGKLGMAPASAGLGAPASAGLGAPASAGLGAPAPAGLGAPAGKLGAPASAAEPFKPGPAAGQTAP
jgi:hypothetical protein